MLVSLSALYAAVLALIVTALAINVTVHRGKFGINLGDNNHPQMLRMVRMHGNAAEQIPLALVLMLVFEINGGSHTALHIAGTALVISRLLHAWGLWTTEKPNFGRVAGQSVTWLTTAALAVLNIVKVI
jgi:uncharacterized membrane protein YecN with MAPEG domain